MKAYIKGGLFLALGWLANEAGGQEIQFRASPSKSTMPIVIAPPPEAIGAGASVRAVSLSQPTALEAPATDGTATPAFRPIVRAQKADEITIIPIPKLETGGKDGQPKPMPKDPNFTPPPPTAVTPSPVYGGLGMTSDGCFDSCGPHLGRSRFCSEGAGVSERRRAWASAEYLMWWQNAQDTPPLIATSPAGTALANAAIIGVPGTSVLYDQTPNPMRSGGRFTAGTWFPRFCNNVGIDASFFYLARSNGRTSFASDGTTILGRPFIDSVTGTNAELFSFPGLASGFATVNNYSQLWGMEANLRYKWHTGSSYWIDIVGGYRHLNLSEGIDIVEDVTAGPLTGAPGLRFVESESFHTRTQFNGVQLGLDSETRIWNRCFIGLRTMVALGNAHHIVNINGTTTFTNVPGVADSVQRGALLASPTNIGKFTQNRFAVVPEVTMKLGYDVTDNLRIFAGYNFLYLSSAVRPGDQIDLNFNQTFTPTPFGPGVGVGPRVPAVLFRTSDYWAQGLTFGMQYRY